jgi:hypothetical protein
LLWHTRIKISKVQETEADSKEIKARVDKVRADRDKVSREEQLVTENCLKKDKRTLLTRARAIKVARVKADRTEVISQEERVDRQDRKEKEIRM